MLDYWSTKGCHPAIFVWPLAPGGARTLGGCALCFAREAVDLFVTSKSRRGLLVRLHNLITDITLQDTKKCIYIYIYIHSNIAYIYYICRSCALQCVYIMI